MLTFRRIGVSVVTLVAAASVLQAHDLFLKPESFFLSPNEPIRVAVLNGTFTSSEAAVARDRLRDLSVAGPNGVTHPRSDAWNPAEKTTHLHLQLPESGTYTIGASLLPRTIRLEGKDFNSYLEEDGLPDVLAERRARGELGLAARERYSKHVKSVVQVGSARTRGTDTIFGYPAELVPLTNPYRLRSGMTLRVRALVDSHPVSNQVVLAGGHSRSGEPIAERSARTDRDGMVRINLRKPGVWYAKFINMRRVDPAVGDSVDYESKWATLTFAVR